MFCQKLQKYICISSCTKKLEANFRVQIVCSAVEEEKYRRREMSDYLPKELMSDIFTRLPIKSILRCTSVCKSWYSLITSPNFISTHLNRNKEDHILIRPYSINPEDESYQLLCYDENLNEYAQFDSPIRCSNGSECFNIVGSCNGILCLAAADMSGDWDRFYFLNPSIRKSLKLPVPIFTCGTLGKTFAYTLGFGFDPVTNDYKVVRVLHTTFYGFPPHVDLYKLSTGVWENISHVSRDYIFFATTPQAYVNGASHWIASTWDKKSLRAVIVLFNMHDEKFSEMILPSSLINEPGPQNDQMFLFVSEESLCLVDNHDKRKPIDIWMMREYGAPDSWVKQFSIKSCHFARNVSLRDVIFWRPYNGRFGRNELEITNVSVKPMAIRKNGEILWKENRKLLVSVDVEKFKDVDIGKATNGWCHNPRYVNYYQESLVFPDKWTNNCVGDACEESSDLWKRELKDGEDLKGKN